MTILTNLKTNFLFVFFLVTISVFGQSINFEKKSILQAFEFEKAQYGTIKDTIKDFGILKNPQNDINTLVPTKAFIFKREKDDFYPQLHVWYYYDKDSEQIKGIMYNWGFYNPSFSPNKEKDNLEKLTKNEKEFTAKYNMLKKEIEKAFGKPVKYETIADNQTSLIQDVFWEDNEKIINLSIEFDRKLTEIPFVGIESNFRIEVMTTFK